MAARKLARLVKDQALVDFLGRHQILTCGDVLKRGELELLELGLKPSQVSFLRQEAARLITPQPTTAFELTMRSENGGARDFIPTGLVHLDGILRGGLPNGTITEITGPSGCGKTQFSTMMAVLHATRLRQEGGGSIIYIDTEGAFSAERLVQMSRARFPEVYADTTALLDLSQSVHIITVDTCAALLSTLEGLEESVIRWGAKMVLLDSIASLVRKEFDSKSLTGRTDLLSKEASILKYIAETFSIPVIVTNQITTHYEHGDGGASASIGRADGEDDEGVAVEVGREHTVTAALGNTWAHSVNTRLVVEYAEPSGRFRCISVAKSSCAPEGSSYYVIGDSGLEERALPPGLQGHTAPAPTRGAIKVRSEYDQRHSHTAQQHTLALTTQAQKF